MPKGYWIANNLVRDPEGYEAYKRLNAVAFAKYGARFLVRAGAQEVPEGQMNPRSVVIEFPSYQAALDCYNSPEYQLALAARVDISETNLAIVEGYDPE